MRRPDGYLVITDPDPPRGGLRQREWDTAMCRHCQRIERIKPRASPSESGGWCFRCQGFICGPCSASGTCEPWEQQMERMEARERFRRAVEGL